MTELDTPRTDLHPTVEVHPADGTTRGVVLVLHGGKAESWDPSESTHLSSRRINPFVTAIHRQGRREGIAVWKVRYRFRGWNGSHRSPVEDAQWALDEVRRRHGDVPVVLLGHSMGGRAAVHVLGDPAVIGMVAFGPWLPDEPYAQAAGKRVVIAHGTLDKWTQPSQSLHWSELARGVAKSVTYVHVRWTGHFMLWNAWLWTDLAVGVTLTWLGVTPSIGRRATNILQSADTGVTVVTV